MREDIITSSKKNNKCLQMKTKWAIKFLMIYQSAEEIQEVKL